MRESSGLVTSSIDLSQPGGSARDATEGLRREYVVDDMCDYIVEGLV